MHISYLPLDYKWFLFKYIVIRISANDISPSHITTFKPSYKNFTCSHIRSKRNFIDIR